MSLRTSTITRDNWRQIATLSVSDQQRGYVEDNAFSLAQSTYEPEWISVGLYDDETAVGYAMYGIDLENGELDGPEEVMILQLQA